MVKLEDRFSTFYGDESMEMGLKEEIMLSKQILDSCTFADLDDPLFDMI